ncbi:MAG: TolB family protein [Acidimicrobiales bacterium]
MIPATVTDKAIEMMLRDRGGAMVPSGLESDIVAAIRAESARANTPSRRWLARRTVRPALAFALVALLVAAGLAATYVGGQNGITVPAGTASPAPSASSAPSPASDGLILFTVYDQVGPSSCATFHTIRPDGSDEQQLAVGCPVFGSASWSPAGDGVIIDSSPLSGNPTQISKVAIDGSAPHVLLTVPGVTPALSPDGSHIAYEERSGIFIAAADGRQPRKLTSTPDPTKSADSEPSFAPDGSRLVFTRMTTDPSGLVGDTTEVWMVNADGTNLHRLTAGLSGSSFARWSPDGSHLLFRARRR